MKKGCFSRDCKEEKCEPSGVLIDFITGEEAADTVVERIRQGAERFLVEKKDYSKGDIEVGKEFEIVLGGEKLKLMADIIVRVGGRRAIIVKCTYDSLGSKERLIVSYARLLGSYQIPYAVIINAEGAEVLDASSGEVIGSGMESIPSKGDLDIDKLEFTEISEDRLEKEKRILSAFESLDEALCGK